MRRLSLRIHQFIPYSLTNGPGKRSVVWVQGCSLGCPGCFNPETHSFHKGTQVDIESLADRILELDPAIEGITLSGGEPFQQAKAIHGLLERIKQQSKLTVLAFTGFTIAELRKIRYADPIIAQLDVLIAGRYMAELRLANGLIGSTNKEVHFLTSRYSPEDMHKIPEAEVFIQPGGDVLLSGIDPILWQ